MKNVVITGSTRGIGCGLADSFLDLDCAVTVSGRSSEAVDRAVENLSANHEPARVFGCPCDVTDFQQVQALWDRSSQHYGKVDIWINNAGISGPRRCLWEQNQQDIEAVIRTNLVGTMFGSKVAVNGMLDQGFGAIYVMEGAGSDGRRIVEGMSVYGTSKYGLRYFYESLVEETRHMSLIVGSLSPGMVLTEFLTGQEHEHPEDWEANKRIFNILADRVETVTPWLAERVLANEHTGVSIRWLTRTKAMGRFLRSPFTKRDIFADPE